MFNPLDLLTILFSGFYLFLFYFGSACIGGCLLSVAVVHRCTAIVELGLTVHRAPQTWSKCL